MTERANAYHETGKVDGRDGTMRRRVVVSSDDWEPPSVRVDLRRGGGRLDATVCLAPDDARTLAALLLAEADHVEAGQAVPPPLLAGGGTPLGRADWEAVIAMTRADVDPALYGVGTGGDGACAVAGVGR